MKNSKLFILIFIAVSIVLISYIQFYKAGENPEIIQQANFPNKVNQPSRLILKKPTAQNSTEISAELNAVVKRETASIIDNSKSKSVTWAKEGKNLLKDNELRDLKIELSAKGLKDFFAAMRQGNINAEAKRLTMEQMKKYHENPDQTARSIAETLNTLPDENNNDARLSALAILSMLDGQEQLVYQVALKELSKALALYNSLPNKQVRSDEVISLEKIIWNTHNIILTRTVGFDSAIRFTSSVVGKVQTASISRLLVRDLQSRYPQNNEEINNYFSVIL